MEPILTKHYKPILEECFKADQELLDKWHIESPNTLKKCVNRTYRDLRNCPDFCFMKIVEDGKLIGYFGMEERDDMEFLTGFFN